MDVHAVTHAQNDFVRKCHSCIKVNQPPFSDVTRVFGNQKCVQNIYI